MNFSQHDGFKLTMQPNKITIFKRQNPVIQLFKLFLIGFRILRMALKH